MFLILRFFFGFLFYCLEYLINLYFKYNFEYLNSAVMIILRFLFFLQMLPFLESKYPPSWLQYLPSNVWRYEQM